MYPIKILHIMTRLPVGGVENQLLSILRNYDKSKLSPLVCSLSDKGQIGEEIERDGIEVVCLNKLGHKFNWSIVKDICSLIKERNIKAVRTHQYHANLYGRLAAHRAGVPCVVASIHNTYTRDKKFHRRLINRFLARFTDRIVAVSGKVRDDILMYDHIPSDKVEVIHNGVDIDIFSNKDGKVKKSEFGIQEDAVVIGTVGRLAEAKGQRYLLEALAVLKDRFPMVRLLIAGDGPLRKDLEGYAETLGIKQNVLFLGIRRDIPALLSVMDIFVLPSLWEGLPNALLEAMAGSRPIIATDIPSFREIIDSKDVGILIPPGDSAALAEALRVLLEDRNKREAMGRNAKQRCSLLFDIKAVVSAYTGLFENILKGKENAL
jgi:glycosyltransferase involved in cell wall biosynthesis